MPTRFYFTSLPASYTPTTVRGAWTTSTQSSTRAAAHTYALDRTMGGANVAMAADDTLATNPNRVLLHRHVSGPLVGGTVPAGTNPFTHVQARQESNAAANMVMYIHIFFTIGDTDAMRGTAYLPGFTGGTEYADVAMTALSYNTPTGVVATTIQAGDRMVIEIGWAATNTVSTLYTGTVQIGGTAGDLAAGTTGVLTNSPWIEWPAAADAALAALAVPTVTYRPPRPRNVARYRASNW